MNIKKDQDILPTLSESNSIFALDIGTRSVVGILGMTYNENFHVIDYEQRFHPERAMRDGQIEDIELVSNVVKDLKLEIEARNHIKITSVSIAAAGRTLKTNQVSYEQELDSSQEITSSLLQNIEYCAVGAAQEKFYKETDGEDVSLFYCVGYSIISHALDGYIISTPIGHKCKKITVTLIAAFLPQNIVQSLYAVTQANNLTVDNLTLEPIAAINVIVPKDIRLLNIALVDIGAGTSDIAISKNGSIIAYDMVTIAGDEVTEAIMQAYLTDFQTAENIKIHLSKKDNVISYTNIFGITCSVPKSKVMEILQPTLEALSETISNRIVEINCSVPLAVFLTGDGSQIPDLCSLIAKHLDMPPEHVSIGGRQGFKKIKVFTDNLLTPEFITPIGIGAMTSFYKGCDFFSITINGKKMMLLNYGESKVMDALLLSSIKPHALIGISPRPLIYYINGEKFTLRGGISTPGVLYVNGKPSSIDTKIYSGDDITVTMASNESGPTITIKELQDNYAPIKLTIDDFETEFAVQFFKDDVLLDDTYVVQSMDRLQKVIPITISDVFKTLHFNPSEKMFLLNGNAVSPDETITNGDVVKTYEKIDLECSAASIKSNYKKVL